MKVESTVPGSVEVAATVPVPRPAGRVHEVVLVLLVGLFVATVMAMAFALIVVVRSVDADWVSYVAAGLVIVIAAALAA